LSFISTAAEFSLDFVSVAWQPVLERPIRGAPPMVQQGQIDAGINLAIKRSLIESADYIATKQQNSSRFRAMVYELIALELLEDHPNVIDSLGISWETDRDTGDVWPVLLTESSRYGNMEIFLQSEEGKALDILSKRKLLQEIATACLAMQNLGEDGPLYINYIFFIKGARSVTDNGALSIETLSRKIY
jgi:hypothetical protein